MLQHSVFVSHEPVGFQASVTPPPLPSQGHSQWLKVILNKRETMTMTVDVCNCCSEVCDFIFQVVAAARDFIFLTTRWRSLYSTHCFTFVQDQRF